MKRLLITGASPRSFVGGSLAERLAGDYEIFAPGRAELDLTDAAALRAWLRKNPVDAVLHCAVHGQGAGGELEADLRMFFALADCRELYGRMVYFGSGAEYDKRRSLNGVREEEIGAFVPADAYGFGKYVMNEYARASENIINLRLFSGYGPRENWRARFISGLCCKALLGLPLTLRRDCRFDFVYIEDIAKAVRWALEANPAHADYNLSCGQGRALSEVAGMVRTQSGAAAPVKILSDEAAPDYVGDNSRLAGESGIAFTPLAEGIAAMLAHYRRHLHEIDPASLST